MKQFNRGPILRVLAGLFFLGFLAPTFAFAAGPAAVNLLTAGNFVVLSKAGITNTGSHTSVITGNIGASPITAAAMNNVFCSEITGTIYGVDAAYTGSGATTCFAGNPGVPPVSPTNANKTLVDNAVLDMGTAYTDAAGRTTPDGVDLGTAGNIGGLTFAPGLYKFNTDVTIPTSITLSGGANDVWIFQISGNLSIASAGSVPSGVKVILAGGALASNVFWQVGGVTGATLGTFSTFNGTILSAAQVIIQTGAVLNGRALAQTQVTLDANTISLLAVAPIVIGASGIVSTDGNAAPRIAPIIGILKVPTPLALPLGAGTVVYNYTVWNVGGQVDLDDVTVTDDKCAPVVYVSGDTNGNNKLNPGENWKYTCTTTLSNTTTNTAVATGYSDDAYHQSAIATAIATVVVGASSPAPLINVVKVPNILTPLPFGGGNIVYTYTVTDPGAVGVSDVTLTDDKCSAISNPTGDTNDNGVLDPGESWIYTCQANVPVSTASVATAQGTGNGFTVLGYAFANVLVATPGLPNTGFPSSGNTSWTVVILAVLLGLVSASLLLTLRKQHKI